MREKYESLPLKELKAVAKARGLKNISTLKKSELVERMLEEDEKDAAKAAAEAAKAEAAKVEEPVAENMPETKAPAKRGRKPKIKTEEAETPAPTRRGRKPKIKTEEAEASENTKATEPADAADTAESSDSLELSDAQDGADAAESNAPVRERKREGIPVHGILEIMSDGYGFMRGDNYLPTEGDVYVSPTTIRRYNLRTGDMITGFTRTKNSSEKFAPLVYTSKVNGMRPDIVARRTPFEKMTPIFPNQRIRLENPGGDVSMRIVDLVSPVGKGQRGMIVSPPKAGKTTLLKQIAKAVLKNAPEMHMIILLIDERPEEVTDMKEAIQGPNVEIIYSTFDELPEHHKRVSEMVMERAKRLVEAKQDVIILLDSITRLARAYNLIVPPSGRTLSGGIDPAALHMPKKFFGAARNMREGGSLTILATALVDTGSKMDDVVYEEFKGTGNMELVLDRKLSEKRVFPALDIVKSSTRREDLLLDKAEQEAVNIMRKSLNGLKTDEAVESILNLFSRTDNNRQFVGITIKRKF